MSRVALDPRPVPRSGARGFWLLLWALYTTQFIGTSFLSTGLTGILRAGGAELSTLGLLQLLGLVWPVKFLWAPLLDRWSPGPGRGHYRSWLLLLQGLMVLSLLGLAAFSEPTRQLGPVVLLTGAFVLFSATQDVAADALSVRGLAPGGYDAAAGVQVAASYVGTLVGGGLALLVHDLWGWRAAVLFLAACTALALVTVVRHAEPPRAPRPRERLRVSDVFGVLARPGARSWGLAAVPLITLGSGAVWALVTPALVDAGWSLARIGVVTSVVASVPALAAALGAGRLCRSRGRAPTMLVGAGIQLLGGVSFVPLVLAQLPVSAAGGLALGVVGTSCVLAGYTVTNTAVYAVNLDLAREQHAGGDFTLLTSFAMFGGIVGSWAGLSVAGASGYAVALLGGLACSGIGIGIAHATRRRRG